ncbi:MAG: DNA translocase FtsK 4TM domain-containing protein, partial [Bacteroidota bacterium]
MGKSTTKQERYAPDYLSKMKSFFNDERLRIVLFLFFLSLSIYLSFAFISHFFSWQYDQSFRFQEVVSSSDITVENWAGKQGARLADLFITKWFGLAAFVFPFLLIIIAFHLINKKLLPLGKTLRASLIGIILLSISLGFVFREETSFLGSGPGGFHGVTIANWFIALIGAVGTALLLLIAWTSFIVFTVPASVDWMRSINYRLIHLPFLQKIFGTPGVDNEFESHQSFEGEEDVKLDEKEYEPISYDQITNVPGDNPEGEVEFDTEYSGTEDKTEVAAAENDNDPDDDLTIERTSADDKRKEESESIGLENEQQEEEQAFAKEDDDGVKMTVEHNEEKEFTDAGNQLEEYDPTLDLSNYKLPPLDLLEKHESVNAEVSDEELISNKNRIVDTLANYKIQINKIKATIGPTVTLYEIVPAPGVRISKIKNLEDDIALSLAALGIRIIAPIPGRGTIGIEVPNSNPQIVSMRSILSSKKFQESKADLAVAIGRTISNETYVFDLAKMPHLLVAGATGQGKSVGLNAIITSLLYKKHPSQLKLIMIDPKKVELSIYSKIEKHFLAKLPDTEEAIITDTQKVINTLNSLCIEMDQRYDLLKKAHVRNLKEYNGKFIARKLNPDKGHKYLPYMVLVIDEFADLIMTAGKEVEGPIARLAQLARAVGIHLIIATQRPTTNIITGVIKANFPARIGFKVMSSVDSRTILDSPGANQLIGRGDMLITSGNDLVRIQCAFIDTEEVDQLNEFIGDQQGYPDAFLLPEYVGEESAEPGEVDLSKRDAMFEEAARLVVMHQQGSTSLIQRKLSIGYNRAGRI